jgi:nucleoside 2-deoxyribosyltransferase
MIDQQLMSKKPADEFFILGGAYTEICQDPGYKALFGSGFRAALALADAIPGLQFKTCLAEPETDDFLATCRANGIRPTITTTTTTITFSYLHPLKKPEMYPLVAEDEMFRLTKFQGTHVLLYGMAEAIIPVESEWLVYDPQSLIPYEATGCTAKHLAFILNKKEAAYFCGIAITVASIEELGEQLLNNTAAEVVVIKNGAAGAWIFEKNGVTHIPVFKTPQVWPIGSGDIFSAVFAWQWMHLKQPAGKAALLASKFTATYCATKQLPLPKRPNQYPALKFKQDDRAIYLAGPFFTQAERWLIQELKDTLEDFGQNVFSPWHDVGVEGGAESIAKADLKGIDNAKTVLAVVSGLDAGTLFEIGYARAKRKKVVVFAENVKDEDLLMLIGSGCVVTSDLSTAIYTVSW